VRDDDAGGVEGRELALEPLEARDVEVVRRLVEQQEVRIAAERARERGASQLAAGEGGETALESGDGEAESSQHGLDAVAPRVAARVFQPRLGARVGRERRLVVRAGRHRPLEASELGFRREEVARTREDVLAQREVRLDGRTLVVQGYAGALLEGQLTAVEAGLSADRAQERRLAGAVPTREGEAVATVELEAHAVEERLAGDLLPQVRGDEDGHAGMVANRSQSTCEGGVRAGLGAVDMV
jgi:hypothetical protein